MTVKLSFDGFTQDGLYDCDPRTHTDLIIPALKQARHGPSREEGKRAAADSSRSQASIQSSPRVEKMVELPYMSDKSFSDFKLCKELQAALDQERIVRCSAVQAKALGDILSGRDTAVQAQSGTGKTTLMCIALISSVDLAKTLNGSDRKSTHCQAICTAPTRELAVQIHEQVTRLGRFLRGLVVDLVIPRSNYMFRPEGAGHIVIGTNGKLVDLAVEKGLIAISRVRLHVMDEADKMLTGDAGAGHRALTLQILAHTRSRGNRPQLVMFMATQPQFMRRDIRGLMRERPKLITLRTSQLKLTNIRHYRVRVGRDFTKFDALDTLFGLFDVGQTIIFVNSTETANGLGQRLRAEGHGVGFLYGRMAPEERDAAFGAFKNGRTTVLIATDVVARGVDVVSTNFVVNYEIPRVMGRGARRAAHDEYIHRVGRCGRFKRRGCAINFVRGKSDEAFLRSIESHFQLQMRELHVTESNLASIEALVEKDRLRAQVRDENPMSTTANKSQ